MENVNYGGWQNCIRLQNGKVELIATTDVGPRIVRFGFIGGENEFYEDSKQIGTTGGDEWKAYGGHRLWIAPEAKPRTYFPDNFPVKVESIGNSLRLTPDIENTTGMLKEIQITLDQKESHVEVLHIITNHNLWDVEMAPWALSVMNGGGRAVLPQEPYSPHPDIPDEPGQVIDHRYYLPVRNLVLWSYTKLNDPRWTFTEKYILLKQDANSTSPQKLGISSERNWAAYARKGNLFVKKVEYVRGAAYPDNGCVFEVFTNPDMLELESFGPVVKLAPGESVIHREDWYLFDGVEFDDTDESIDWAVIPKVSSILR